jgi:hypothetical protein
MKIQSVAMLQPLGDAAGVIFSNKKFPTLEWVTLLYVLFHTEGINKINQSKNNQREETLEGL